MPVKFKDYYKILGVERSSSADEIKKSFRNLAKKYHPDRAKGDKKAEDRFKEINEAYEVLGDPEKKKRYDTLGANWQQGQEFTPPPEWESIFTGGSGRQGGGATYSFEGGDISDFFDFFRGGNRHSNARGARGAGGGGGGGTGGGMFENLFTGMGGGAHRAQANEPAHVETDMTITLDEAYRGGTKKVSLARADGQRQTYDIKIPAGIREGQKIRLKGEGEKAGSHAGDLLIRIHIAPHPVYTMEGSDLVAELKVSPWEAVLGAKISVPTPDGNVEMKLPAGVRTGQRLRLSGRGFPQSGGKERGDLYVKPVIEVPKAVTTQERELWEKLQHISKFNPRAS